MVGHLKTDGLLGFWVTLQEQIKDPRVALTTEGVTKPSKEA